MRAVLSGTRTEAMMDKMQRLETVALLVERDYVPAPHNLGGNDDDGEQCS